MAPCLIQINHNYFSTFCVGVNCKCRCHKPFINDSDLSATCLVSFILLLFKKYIEKDQQKKMKSVGNFSLVPFDLKTKKKKLCSRFGMLTARRVLISVGSAFILDLNNLFFLFWTWAFVFAFDARNLRFI